MSFVSYKSHIMQVQSSKKTVSMPSYRFSTKFKLTLHLIFFLNFVGNVLYSHSVLYDIIENSRQAKHIRTNGHHIIISPGKAMVNNF